MREELRALQKNRFAEECVPFGTQQEIQSVAVRIYGSIQILPLPLDLDVCFIDSRLYRLLVADADGCVCPTQVRTTTTQRLSVE